MTKKISAAVMRSLSERYARIQQQIHDELNKPYSNWLRVTYLKRLRLRVKERMYRLSMQVKA
ncbi:MAG: DUF465 domain-containing protein [Alphaproteobacteria bacterium]